VETKAGLHFERKKSIFISCIVLITLVVSIDLYYFYFSFEKQGSLQTFVFIAVFLFIIPFIYYAFTYLLTPLVNYFYVRKLLRKRFEISKQQSSKPVAVLYPTCNDFDETAAESYLGLEYSNYHLFILDDSNSPEYQKRVDGFQKLHKEKVTITRRDSNKAYKAGNLNNAIFNHCKNFEFLLIVDADEIVPEDFLKKLVPYFDLDDKIAYVQASSTGREEKGNPFVNDLYYFINLYWDNFLPLKNKYGFSAILGHGVLLKRKALIEVGGFPEIVSEDIAMTLRIREKGYFGIFVPGVWGFESFPQNIQTYRKRQFRWTKADMEVCVTHLSSYIKSKGISLTEKIDAITRELKIPFAGLMPVFLILVSFLGSGYPSGAEIVSNRLDMIHSSILFIISLAPVWAYIVRLYQKPIKLSKFLFNWFFLEINIIFLQFYGFVSYLFTRKVIYVATGAKDSPARNHFNLKEMIISGTPNHPAFLLIELLYGLLLLVLSIINSNLFLIGISSGIIFYLPVATLGWGSKLSQVLKVTPSVFIILGLLTDIFSNSFDIIDYISIIGISLILI